MVWSEQSILVHTRYIVVCFNEMLTVCNIVKKRNSFKSVQYFWCISMFLNAKEAKQKQLQYFTAMFPADLMFSVCFLT